MAVARGTTSSQRTCPRRGPAPTLLLRYIEPVLVSAAAGVWLTALALLAART